MVCANPTIGFDCGQRNVVVPSGIAKPLASCSTTPDRVSPLGSILYLNATSRLLILNITSIAWRPSFENSHTASVASYFTWLFLMVFSEYSSLIVLIVHFVRLSPCVRSSKFIRIPRGDLPMNSTPSRFALHTGHPPSSLTTTCSRPFGLSIVFSVALADVQPQNSMHNKTSVF